MSIPIGFELLLTNIHGHIAMMAVALCLHPVLTLRKARTPGPRVRLSAYLATAFMFATVAIGWIVYPEYRRAVRQGLYIASRPMGLAFEVKEHIGTFALALVLAGAVVTVLSTRPGMGPRSAPVIRRLYGTAALLSCIAALLGLLLSGVAGFPYGVD